jgi:WD40 repeat protein
MCGVGTTAHACRHSWVTRVVSDHLRSARTVPSTRVHLTASSWCGLASEDGTHLRTLVGDVDGVGVYRYRIAVAVGIDGNVFSGLSGPTVFVWSPDDGALLQTLESHDCEGGVLAFAAGPDGKLFSGSYDGTVSVLNVDNGTVLHKLLVYFYDDSDIGEDDEFANNPHENGDYAVNALAVGPNGTLYSGCSSAILVWR